MNQVKITPSYAVIGDPINHSKSPLLINDIYNQIEKDATYSKLLITEMKLLNFVNKFRLGQFDGINVTTPYKSKIIPMLDSISNRAKLIGAVNCVSKDDNILIGHNTDWYGFTKLLYKNNIEIKNKSVLIIGAGGVSKAILFSILQKETKLIYLTNRTNDKAKKLVDHFNKIKNNNKIKLLPFTENKLNNIDFDLIINCTSIGMYPDIYKSPIPNYNFNQNQIVIDIIYNPQKTQLLIDAEKASAKTINGLDMFIYQGLESVNIWLRTDLYRIVNISQLKNKIIKSYAK